MSRVTFAYLILIMLLFAFGCGSEDFHNSHTVPTPTPPKVVKLEVEATAPAVAGCGEETLKAIAYYDDNSSKDVTAQAKWSSSSADFSVGNGGVAKASYHGAADISAEFEGVQGSAHLNITPAVAPMGSSITDISSEDIPSQPGVPGTKNVLITLTNLQPGMSISSAVFQIYSVDFSPSGDPAPSIVVQGTPSLDASSCLFQQSVQLTFNYNYVSTDTKYLNQQINFGVHNSANSQTLNIPYVLDITSCAEVNGCNPATVTNCVNGTSPSTGPAVSCQ